MQGWAASELLLKKSIVALDISPTKILQKKPWRRTSKDVNQEHKSIRFLNDQNQDLVFLAGVRQNVAFILLPDTAKQMIH